MATPDWNETAVTLLSGGALTSLGGFLWRRLRRDPKSQAEARKLNAEASHVEWQTLRDEIDRLTKTVRAQGRCIAELKASAEKREDRETALENENKHLRSEVSALRKRVGQLEEIIKTRTTPEDMRAQLAAIDRKTGGTEP